MRDYSHPDLLARYAILRGPSLVCVVCLLAASVVLIVSRSPEWVLRVRSVLAVSIAVRVVAIVMDAQMFPRYLSSDFLALWFPIIYFWYFSVSERVRWVFAPIYSGQRRVPGAGASNHPKDDVEGEGRKTAD